MSVPKISDGMPIVEVADSAALSELCVQWSNTDFLAVDTEFERTNTFYARIGLLQIADSENCYLVDPFKIDDWSAFKSLLVDSNCTLVMHSCSEDLNLLQTFLGCVPKSLFDSQLAAAFLGIGFSISYQGLVEKLVGIDVPKDETRSDWMRRPLSEKQLQYAATDVRYLLEVREILSARMEAGNMISWFQAECARQLVLAKNIEEESMWQNYYSNISNAWRLELPGLHALQKLSLWRERKARERNKPRNWIAKDADLLNLCAALTPVLESHSLRPDDLDRIEAVDQRFLSRNADELLALLGEVDGPDVDIELPARPLGASLRKKLKLCKQVATAKAEELGMAPELLGRKKYLTGLLKNFEGSGELNWPDDAADWRRGLLEAELTQVLVKS